MNILKTCVALRMKSISTRLAIWYTLAATTTFACLIVSGFFLLQRHLIHGLDMLNVSEFGEVKAHLQRDFEPNDPTFLERRLRKPSERTGALFYVDLRDEQSGATFHSTNLNGRTIPNPDNQKTFNVNMDGIGELRVAKFRLDPYTVIIATPHRGVHNVTEGFAETGLMLLGAMAAASLLIGFVLSRLALRPVRLISETANRIRSDNLSERIAVGKVRDEISDLSVMLNQMFDRLESSFNQIRRFSAEASHELKTPLSLMRLYSEKMLLDGGLSPAHEEALQLQLEELARLDQIIEEMLFLSRTEANAITLNLQLINPARFLQGFTQDARALAEHQGKQFAHTHDGDGRIAIDDKRLRQVLLNLLTNALAVSPPGGQVTLRSLLENSLWRITMEDEGPGLPPDQLERIFERFVRFTRPGGEDKGNGLGLAICRGIVTLHRGRIFAIANPAGRGLLITIEIPATSV